MKRWIIFLTMGVWLFLPESILSQEAPKSVEGDYNRLGQSSMTFLDIDVGARAVGMGSAFTCMDNDANTLFWNPAGIAKIKGRELSLNHTQWIVDMKQYAFAAAYGMGNIGTFGVSFMMMDNGSIVRTIPNRPFEDFPEDYESHPEGFYIDGTVVVEQWAAGIAYARQITDKFSIGGQIKYVYEDLGETDIAVPFYDSTEASFGYKRIEDAKNRENVIAFDFGTIYYFGFKDLRVGMSFRNFAQPVKYGFESFNLPVTFKVAMTMNVLSFLNNQEDHALHMSVVAVNPYDGGNRLHIGGEYMLYDLLALRAGYRTNKDIDVYSFGFGLTPNAFNGINLKIDYAYSSADAAFGAIHRFSFGFTL
jgi:long-subunit fatty acid transport protein